VSRRRADTLLAERGLAASRSAAAASVRAGRVRLGRDGPEVSKPGQLLPEDAELVVEGRRCLDIGASTGGFTDCLLRAGAEAVVALDVGYGQLDWRLRQDPRVIVMERVNARNLNPDELPWRPGLITVDVSFISLAKLLDAIVAVGAEDLDLLALVKPQFELGPEQVGGGGVVRDPDARRDALRAVAGSAGEAGLVVRGFASSGLPGPKGNLETFIWCSWTGERVDVEVAIREVEP
jgi:23S rRNA (cytidine1920-2'-O)/16S rRNA (cytidine1409-2'-O)-methyltransferase